MSRETEEKIPEYYYLSFEGMGIDLYKYVDSTLYDLVSKNKQESLNDSIIPSDIYTYRRETDIHIQFRASSRELEKASGLRCETFTWWYQLTLKVRGTEHPYAVIYVGASSYEYQKMANNSWGTLRD